MSKLISIDSPASVSALIGALDRLESLLSAYAVRPLRGTRGALYHARRLFQELGVPEAVSQINEALYSTEAA